MRRKVLLCELVQQAFLMTARDEFDLSTRDGWLQETADVREQRGRPIRNDPARPAGRGTAGADHPPVDRRAYFAGSCRSPRPSTSTRRDVEPRMVAGQVPGGLRAAGCSPPRRAVANGARMRRRRCEEEAAAGLVEERFRWSSSR